jgi:hypothetical protein
MSFKSDDVFSKHKDIMLKPYWEAIAYEGRFVLTASTFLQKICGIDIIMQYKSYMDDLTIDTKHVRGDFSALFLEEMSNSTDGYEKPGWILKETGHPDWVLYFMHPECKNCYKNCFEKCIDNYNVLRESKMFAIEFPALRKWFIENKFAYRYMYAREGKEINKTTGRIVPIIDMLKCNVIRKSETVYKLLTSNNYKLSDLRIEQSDINVSSNNSFIR